MLYNAPYNAVITVWEILKFRGSFAWNLKLICKNLGLGMPIEKIGSLKVEPIN